MTLNLANTDWLKAFDRYLGRYQGTSLETYADQIELIRSYEAKGLSIEEAFKAFQIS